ncbi:MAG: hypothetical protein J07HQX50_01335 [Haloquadratum sp. J07HQX50]|nr:MAG: hypothetical protein J07HQX50_01335 [Haloquadratum sp. J07HQX50]
MTDRHHASNGNYDDDAQNQIGGIIPAFSLSSWLRTGWRRPFRSAVVPPVTPARPANFWKDGVYNRDFDARYYPKGDCLGDQDENGNGYVILYLFGGFGNRPGKVMRHSIQFSPVRSSVDYTRHNAKGHYAGSTGMSSPETRKTTRSRCGTPNSTPSGTSTVCGNFPFRETSPSSSRCSPRPPTT